MTCVDCNNTSGHELDVHIHEGAKAAEIAAGARAEDVRLDLAGKTITGRAQMQNGVLDLVGDPRRSDPKAHEAFIEELRRASEVGGTDITFNMSWKSRHDPWRESVAWLRVGYLYAFAALGFLYILRPVLEIVRTQIRNPHDRIVPQLVKHFNAPPGFNAIQFVFEPIEFRSIIVIHGRRAIVLPDFEYPSTFEDRIMGAANDRWPRRLSGKQIPLPRQAEYLLDFHPTAVRLISPDLSEDRGNAV